MSNKNVKAIILVAGPQKGTRFRPLSLEVPKPLFPVAGFPLIEHHIASCKQVKEVTEVVLLGFYQSNDIITRFVDDMKRKYMIKICYLQEYQPLGTAGGLYHFRDQLVGKDLSAFIVIHADIFCVLPLSELLELYFSKNNKESDGNHIVLGTRVNKSQLSNSEHGNIVVDHDSLEVTHYVEKPESYVSGIINCGVYVFNPSVLQSLAKIYQQNETQIGEDLNGSPVKPGQMFIEKHLFPLMAGTGKLFCLTLKDSFWGSMKSAGSAIFANRQYLSFYKNNFSNLLAKQNDNGPEIVGDVFIHQTATIDPTAKIGPNVSIGSYCVIGPGVRVKESIILDGAELRDNCCVLNSIIGWKCLVGAWARIEGTPHDPNPNFPHALITNESLFHPDGHLIPSITVLGCNVIVPRETIVMNSIVLPHKELTSSHKNQIIL